MTKDVSEIRGKLVEILKEHIGVLKVSKDSYENFEVTGTIPAMQGKKKVDGYYFASVVPKSKDVRLYFFPAYTHKEQLGELPEELKKFLKGKSCFHVKRMDENIENQLKSTVQKAIDLYQKDGLI